MKAFIDKTIFENGFKCISDFGNDDLLPHFIYCGNHYFDEECFELMISDTMKRYGIQSLLLTVLKMVRINLVTKEIVKLAYEGGMKGDRAAIRFGNSDWIHEEFSINDDLESLLIKIQNDEEKIHSQSFFTPKLTNDELKLVQQGDNKHLKTYEYDYPDINIEEMKKSNSKSKYVHVSCARQTFSLVNEHTAENRPIYPAYWFSYTDDDLMNYDVLFYTWDRTYRNIWDRKDDNDDADESCFPRFLPGDPKNVPCSVTSVADHAFPNLCHRELIRSLVDQYYSFRLNKRPGGVNEALRSFAFNFAPLPDHEYFRLLKTRDLNYVKYAIIKETTDICSIRIYNCDYEWCDHKDGNCEVYFQIHSN